MTSVVSDTTALIVLAAQQRLDLLAGCFDRVLLPDAVYREWLAGDPGVAGIVQQRSWLEMVSAEEVPLLVELRVLLDPGEAEALALARQRHLPLIVDEKKGRRVARMMGIPVLGLVGVLLLAVQREVLDPESAKQILVNAKDRGFRLSEGLFEAFTMRLEASRTRSPT
jgi:predicted nucleic acid-binding protein